MKQLSSYNQRDQIGLFLKILQLNTKYLVTFYCVYKLHVLSKNCCGCLLDKFGVNWDIFILTSGHKATNDFSYYETKQVPPLVSLSDALSYRVIKLFRMLRTSLPANCARGNVYFKWIIPGLYFVCFAFLNSKLPRKMSIQYTVLGFKPTTV